MHLDFSGRYVDDTMKVNVTEPDSAQLGANQIKQEAAAGLTGIAGTEMLSQTYVNENDNSL